MIRDCETIETRLPSELDRVFRVMAFDWDGTAAISRSEDAGEVRQVVERLLSRGVSIMVITGTSFPNIDRQLSATIRGQRKRHLFVATNRGSEVYGFDAESRPVRLAQRTATPEEDRLLSGIAEAVRDTLVTRTGLEIGLVDDRLNRRKIDVIPLPEWADPPKSGLGELFQAVQARLQSAGPRGGLSEVIDLTRRVAREKGLAEARITSDVKYVEVGLTDKADAVAWLVRELVQRQGIPIEDVLIVGDEFGPVAGFEGSDYKMVAPDARGAIFVSVGPEPSGVPPGVIHLGGGPACFYALLAHQATLYERSADRGAHH